MENTDNKREMASAAVSSEGCRVVGHVDVSTDFTVGRKFTAVVKAVRPEGVYVEMPNGGSGVVSTKCWGDGAARVAALAKVHPGDLLEVVVRCWHPATKTLSLVLPGFENLQPCSRRKFLTSMTGSRLTSKPQFKTIPAGAIFVFDLASVFGRLPYELIAEFVPTVRASLKAAGYSAVFFLEKKSQVWAWSKTPSPSAAKRFVADCNADDVTIVHRGEADLPVLQTVAAFDSAYAVSADWFADYREAFPQVVGTGRVRKFTIAKLPGGTVLFTIDGVKDGIVIKSATAPAA